MLQSLIRVDGLSSVNDFVIKFANVNGSGSASANTLFGKSIMRMGVPVAPRNIFPSNIQGLPTWYEVRVSEAGHLGARGGGVDLMVAMNPQTWDQDIRSIVPGGYLFYDSTKPMPESKFRDDIVVIGMPLTEICNRQYTDAASTPVIQKHHLCRCALGPARYRRRRSRKTAGRAVPRQGQADRAEHPGAAYGPRLCARASAMPDRTARAALGRDRRPYFHRRQRRRRVGRGLWRGDSLRVVSDHPVLLAGRGVHPMVQSLSRGQGDRAEPLRHRAG